MKSPIFVLMITTFSLAAHGGAYRCVQPNGETHYQQTPCEAQAAGEAIRLDRGPRATDLRAAQRRADEMIQQVAGQSNDDNTSIEPSNLDDSGSYLDENNYQVREIDKEIDALTEELSRLDPFFGTDMRKMWTREKRREIQDEIKLKEQERYRLTGAYRTISPNLSSQENSKEERQEVFDEMAREAQERANERMQEDIERQQNIREVEANYKREKNFQRIGVPSRERNFERAADKCDMTFGANCK